jgi:hypothetical protein
MAYYFASRRFNRLQREAGCFAAAVSAAIDRGGRTLLPLFKTLLCFERNGRLG